MNIENKIIKEFVNLGYEKMFGIKKINQLKKEFNKLKNLTEEQQNKIHLLKLENFNLRRELNHYSNLLGNAEEKNFYLSKQLRKHKLELIKFYEKEK